MSSATFSSGECPQEAGSVDGILCWDFIDYLDKRTAQKLATELTRVLRPEGALLGFFGTLAQQGDTHYTKFIVADDVNLRSRAVSGAAPPTSVAAQPRHHQAVRGPPRLRFVSAPEQAARDPLSQTRMIDFDLTDEHRLLEQTVREWARPRRRPAHPGERSPAPLRPRSHSRRHGEARPARHLGAAGVRRRRHGLHLSRPRQRGARIRRHVAARHHVGARRPELPDAAHVGHRGSEAAVSRAAGAGREDRRLRPHRAGRRQRRARHSDDGRQEGRSVRHHRREERGSRSRTSPTTSSSSPGPTLEKKTAARSLRHQRVHRRARRSRGFRAVR